MPAEAITPDEIERAKQDLDGYLTDAEKVGRLRNLEREVKGRKRELRMAVRNLKAAILAVTPEQSGRMDAIHIAEGRGAQAWDRFKADAVNLAEPAES
jgi:hypothetical protein